MALYVRQLESVQAIAARIAANLGHILTPWERGVSAWNSVATCTSCGLYACATTQPEEDGPIFGSTTKVQCKGSLTIPSWGPPAGSTAP